MAFVERSVSSSFSFIPLSLRLALRELRGGLKGFYIFVACIALGVTAIVSIGALTDAFDSGISDRGRELLGGDIALRRIHQRADIAQKTEFARYGKVSESVTMRAMGRKLDGSMQALVEVKGVDSFYPLYGELKLKDGVKPSLDDDAIAYADPILFARLGLKVGDQIKLGDAVLTLKGMIADEPDRLSSRNAIGPRLLLSVANLEKAGLLNPENLIRWRYKIKLDEVRRFDDEFLLGLTGNFQSRLTDKGFYTLNRLNPTPGISNAITRLSKFLTLVGLTALIIGGVGVANAVTAFIDGKRTSIATFKCLGAPNGLIFRTYLLQILIISGVGIAIGALVGLLAPLAIGALFGAALPIELEFSPQLNTVLIGVLYGFLVSLLFVITPLRRSRDVRPQMLFREASGLEAVKFRIGDLIVVGILGALLLGVAIMLSRAELFALYFCGGLIAIFGLFLFYGRFIQYAAQKLPNIRGAAFVVSRANIAGPGSLARTIILSLGLGLSLLVTVAIIDTSLVNQLRSGLPENAPSHFFLDIKKHQLGDFRSLVKEMSPKGTLSDAPMLRGRIVKLAGKRASEINAPSNAEWALRGDRGITYSATLPKGSELSEGSWWKEDHQGDNLVSFEAEVGKALGLKVGDEVVVNVLGRDLTAKIANFRTVKWESLSINFVMVFSPNTLAGAPVNMLATLQAENGGSIEREGEFLQKLSLKFPNITVIRVRDALDAVAGIYQNIMTAIRAAGGLTLVAGALVLAGALATAHRRRIYESAIFKTLGATRRQIVTAHVIEYIGLSLVTGLLAMILGTISAWAVLEFVLNVEFSFSFVASVQVVIFSIILVLFFGIMGSWRVLSAKTVPHLRGR